MEKILGIFSPSLLISQKGNIELSFFSDSQLCLQRPFNHANISQHDVLCGHRAEVVITETTKVKPQI